MSTTICRAGVLHLPQMAEILNEIIAAGGSTALTGEVSGEEIRRWMARGGGGTRPARHEDAPVGRDVSRRTLGAAWHVAEDDAGRVMGFQWIEPADYLPLEAAEIATFARMGHTGLGIGSRLFEATRAAAKALGYAWINANIRADNASGLIYYQSRGFEDYGRIEGYQMADGTVVDKVLKRYEL